jgi:hypothetical protein
MAQTIKLKRSAQSGSSGIPTTTDLELGEVAINTYHGKMYVKKDTGTAESPVESIVEIGANSGIANVVEDTTPQLGGDLDLNSSDITGTGNINVTGTLTATGGNSTNWNTAYSWGNHASAGYLTSYTESDPVFTAHAAYGITSTKISNWDTAYNNHITGVNYSGSTLTLTQQDGGTLTTTIDTSGSGGGGGGMSDLVDDTTPQLGGDLDLNNHDVSGQSDFTISNGNAHTFTKLYSHGSIFEFKYDSSTVGYLGTANGELVLSDTNEDPAIKISQYTTSFPKRIQVDGGGTTASSSPNIQSMATSNTQGVTNYHATFVRDPSTFTVNGSITTNFYSTSYNTTSDYRVKENIQPMVSSTERLLSLNPVNFQWLDSNERVDGFLAHEVKEVVSDAVVGEKDAVDGDGNPILQALDQAKLVPLLVKTVQELEARITDLENA